MILSAEVAGTRENITSGTKEIKLKGSGEWAYYTQYTKRNNYFEPDNSKNDWWSVSWKKNRRQVDRNINDR